MEDDRTVVPLDYRAPDPPISASRVFVGMLSVTAATIGFFAGAGGLFGVVTYFFQEDGDSADGPEFVVSSAGIVLVGIGFSFLALRWARRALGRERERSGDGG